MEKTKKIMTKRKRTEIGICSGIIAAMVIAVMLGGCIGEKEPGDGTGIGDELSGSLTVTGSTTVLPIAQQTADAFMDKHPEVNIQVSGGGSSVGVQAVGSGTADIGMASRELRDKEKTEYPNLVKHVVARDGVAVILHKNNPVPSLAMEQIKKIYNGEITNCKEVGGGDMPIVVINRDSASGTRETFHTLVMDKEDFVKTALEKNSNGAVKTTVAQTPGAIGYAGLGYVDSKIKAIKVNKEGQLIDPTAKNVADGKYPISRDINMFTDGQPTGLEKAYLDFIKSSEGQTIVEKEGFVSII